MATALAVVAAIGAVVGAVETRKGRKAQKRQTLLANKVSAITRQRDVKRAIATQRVQVAEQQAIGFQLGVAGSSAVAGAGAGVISDTASSIAQSNLQATSQGFLADFSNSISASQGRAINARTVSSIAGGIAQNDQFVAALDSLV